jgi:hypothetical protein
MLYARPGPRPIVSDHLRLFPSMREVPLIGYSRSDRIRRRSERVFNGVDGALLRESGTAAEMLDLLTIGVWAELRVRALDERVYQVVCF